MLCWAQYNDYATGRTVRGSNPEMNERFVLYRSTQTGSGAHPPSHSVATGVLYLR
jgi:hypothetical protein